MVERAFERTLRNFSTIFMIVAAIVAPIHLVYAFTFRNVIATSDYHDAIEAMENGRKVRSVGPRELDQARLAFWIVTAGEIALVPFALRATRRALIVDDEGGVPTASDAWAHAFGRQHARPATRGWLAPAAAGLGAAAAAALLINGIGDGLTAFLSDEQRWAGEAVTQIVTRAGALPLFLGPVAAARAKEEGPSAPKLY